MTRDEMHAAVAALPEPSIDESHLWHAVYCYRWVVLGFEHDAMHCEAEQARLIYRQCVERLAASHLPRHGAEITRLLIDWADVRALEELADDLKCETGEGWNVPAFLTAGYGSIWRKDRDALLLDDAEAR